MELAAGSKLNRGKEGKGKIIIQLYSKRH